MRLPLISATLIACVISASAAVSQTLDDYYAAQEAAISAWIALPLTVTNAGFTTETATGYGLQDIREGTVFYSAEPVFTYAELLGYDWRQNGDGTFTLAIAIDLILRGPGGEIVVDRDNVQNITLSSQHRNRELFTTLRLNLNGAPLGDYVADVTYRDTIGGQATTHSLPFTLTTP